MINYKIIKNEYVVWNTDGYSCINQGDIVKVIDVLDDVAIVEICGKNENMLMRMVDLCPIYKVLNIFDTDDIVVKTDTIKYVLVSVNINGVKASGKALCSPSDTFDLDTGITLAYTRALIEILFFYEKMYSNY